VKRTFAVLAVAAALVGIGVSTAAETASAATATPANYWFEYEASQRLDTGRFGARNGIDFASCIGFGPRQMEYGLAKYRSFDCEAYNEDFDSRDLVLRTTGATSFRVTFLNGWS
jgi:hypothetical protein